MTITEDDRISKAATIIDEAIKRFSKQKLADTNEVIDVLLDARNMLINLDETLTT